MTLVGGDAPALFGFAAQIRNRRAAIEATAARLGALVEAAQWVGPDRERFVSEWRSQHAPALTAICGDLGRAADQVSRHAQRQAETSNS